jgi:hypothetical protein
MKRSRIMNRASQAPPKPGSSTAQRRPRQRSSPRRGGASSAILGRNKPKSSGPKGRIQGLLRISIPGAYTAWLCSPSSRRRAKTLDAPRLGPSRAAATVIRDRPIAPARSASPGPSARR